MKNILLILFFNVFTITNGQVLVLKSPVMIEYERKIGEGLETELNIAIAINHEKISFVYEDYNTYEDYEINGWQKDLDYTPLMLTGKNIKNVVVRVMVSKDYSYVIKIFNFKEEKESRTYYKLNEDSKKILQYLISKETFITGLKFKNN